MKFILYALIIFNINILYSMNEEQQSKSNTEKLALTAAVVNSTPISTAQKEASTTVDINVTLITTFNFPTENSCGGGYKTVQSKQPKTFTLNPDKTLSDCMPQFKKEFDCFFDVSFSSDGSEKKISLTRKLGTVGSHIFAHKYQKLARAPKDREGE